jgi:formylglycine-generating enzyme required for sulfatase activity
VLAPGALPSRHAFWKSGHPPSWAHDWDWDEFGAWVSFQLPAKDGPLTVRLRWIPPGSFYMGMEGGDSFVGASPSHQVTLSEGFWLAEFATSQAVWNAVMGENPSFFRGSDLPVETVSWKDCQDFFSCLENMLPGLRLDLPSEAQWEYACRAGSTTAFWWGDSISSDQANYDTRSSQEGRGEYRGRTAPVDAFSPSPWGLYQMHGNVWEWCRDGPRIYRPRPERDPLGALQAGSLRAFRGGSWLNYARLVRAASRDGSVPDLRRGSLGFRCCQVQAGAEPAEHSTSQAERRRKRVHAGGAARIRMEPGEESTSAPWPDFEEVEIRSDSGELSFRLLRRPAWAESLGQDRHGLWAEMLLGGRRGLAIRQRLRWIPPGRFPGESPQEEREHRGDEGPRPPVTLRQGFWLFDTAVSQELWTAVTGEKPVFLLEARSLVELNALQPVERFLSLANANVPGRRLALPSEAQWQYACRAGSTLALKFRQATFSHTSKLPNPWGLYQMYGKVREWCRDGDVPGHSRTGLGFRCCLP